MELDVYSDIRYPPGSYPRPLARRKIEMKTVQMTLEEELIAAVDRVARRLKTTRSAFTRRALKAALDQIRIQDLEARHREGYRRHPPKKGEFDIWEKEQAWGDG